MDHRYDLLDTDNRRKIVPGDDRDAILLVIDELAYYSTTAGRRSSATCFRSCCATWWPAAAPPGSSSPPRPSGPATTSSRCRYVDLFGYRLAFRCTTEPSSDIILGHGWHTHSYDASTIDLERRGVGFLLAEGSIPRRMRCTWLTDADIREIAARAPA
jgi:S-DNA-T family DNA segregation ATPase FtsK/SpoIIIE